MSTLKKRQTEYIKQLVYGKPIDHARNWLLQVHINSTNGCGWPTSADQDYPSVWGGTLDGIRGLAVAGVSAYDPIIKKSIDWLLSQQRDDGGFTLDDGSLDSPGVTYSSVEATAWVLIALRSAGLDLSTDSRTKNAISYIEKCVGSDGEIGTSDRDSDNPRTYPCLLAVWACYETSNIVKKTAQYLKNIREPITGGWGIKQDAKPNPVTTSQVLYVLMECGYLDRKDVITKTAIKFIASQQKQEGYWENFSENWFSHYQLRYPNYHGEYGTTWALLSLIKYGYPVTHKSVAKGLSWLLSKQENQGYWVYDPRNGTRYIWCVADCIYTLSHARNNLLDFASNTVIERFEDKEPAEIPDNRTLINKGIRLITQFLQTNITNILLAIVLLYTFRMQVNYAISQIYSFIEIKQSDLLSGILSNALYTLMIVLISFLLGLIKRKPK